MINSDYSYLINTALKTTLGLNSIYRRLNIYKDLNPQGDCQLTLKSGLIIKYYIHSFNSKRTIQKIYYHDLLRL